MAKQNAAVLLNRYIWLVDTIYSAGSISREEIDRRWCRSLLCDGEGAIPERTFHRYKEAIQELFNINIEFSKSRGYFIENSSDYTTGEMRKWLISTFSVNNLINEGISLRSHIDFEDIPSGTRFLTPMLEAIRDRVIIRVSHKGFNSPKFTIFKMKPYGLKVFKQRWYVLAESEYKDHRLLVYSLDRFESVERTDDHYEIPDEFKIHDYFRNTYGVTGLKSQLEHVKLKVDASQVKYFRTLPLHKSQKEIETADDYSIFQYTLVPTYELRQEILSHGCSVEVISPKWLREIVKKEIYQLYQ